MACHLSLLPVDVVLDMLQFVPLDDVVLSCTCISKSFRRLLLTRSDVVGPSKRFWLSVFARYRVDVLFSREMRRVALLRVVHPAMEVLHNTVEEDSDCPSAITELLKWWGVATSTCSVSSSMIAEKTDGAAADVVESPHPVATGDDGKTTFVDALRRIAVDLGFGSSLFRQPCISTRASNPDTSPLDVYSAPTLFAAFQSMGEAMELWLLNRGLLPQYLQMSHTSPRRRFSAIPPSLLSLSSSSSSSTATVLPAIRAASFAMGIASADTPFQIPLATVEQAVGASSGTLLHVSQERSCRTAMIPNFEIGVNMSVMGCAVAYDQLYPRLWSPFESASGTVPHELRGDGSLLLQVGWEGNGAEIGVVLQWRSGQAATAAGVSCGRGLYAPGTVVCYRPGEAETLEDTFILSPNLETFWHRWVSGLCEGRFDVDWLYPMISRFPKFSSPRCLDGDGGLVSCAVTEGIEVIVSVLHSYGESSIRDAHYVYVYQCRIRVLPSCPFETVQLTDRHWIVTDLVTGSKDEVRGPGVIGQTPVLHRMTSEESNVTHATAGNVSYVELQDRHRGAWAKMFFYASGTHFRSPRGSMRGEFRFVCRSPEAEGSVIHAAVAEFYCVYDAESRYRFGED